MGKELANYEVSLLPDSSQQHETRATMCSLGPIQEEKLKPNPLDAHLDMERSLSGISVPRTVGSLCLAPQWKPLELVLVQCKMELPAKVNGSPIFHVGFTSCLLKNMSFQTTPLRGRSRRCSEVDFCTEDLSNS